MTTRSRRPTTPASSIEFGGGGIEPGVVFETGAESRRLTSSARSSRAPCPADRSLPVQRSYRCRTRSRRVPWPTSIARFGPIPRFRHRCEPRAEVIHLRTRTVLTQGDGGDPHGQKVLEGRSRQGITMRMRVDEPRCDHPTRGIDDFRGDETVPVAWLPISTMRPSSITRSASNAGPPRPSTMRPPVISRSTCCLALALRWCGFRVCTAGKQQNQTDESDAISHLRTVSPIDHRLNWSFIRSDGKLCRSATGYRAMCKPFTHDPLHRFS